MKFQVNVLPISIAIASLFISSFSQASFAGSIVHVGPADPFYVAKFEQYMKNTSYLTNAALKSGAITENSASVLVEGIQNVNKLRTQYASDGILRMIELRRLNKRLDFVSGQLHQLIDNEKSSNMLAAYLDKQAENYKSQLRSAVASGLMSKRESSKIAQKLDSNKHNATQFKNQKELAEELAILNDKMPNVELAEDAQTHL